MRSPEGEEIRTCFLVIVGTILIKSHYPDSPNVSLPKMTPMDMPKWIGRTLYTRL